MGDGKLTNEQIELLKLLVEGLTQDDLKGKKFRKLLENADMSNEFWGAVKGAKTWRNIIAWTLGFFVLLSAFSGSLSDWVTSHLPKK